MLSQRKRERAGDGACRDGREHLLQARASMAEILVVLDEHSVSAAAANLDLAIHQLDRELSGL